MQIWEKHIKERLDDIDDFLLHDYKKNHPEKKRDWRTYEEQYALRIKEAMKQLKPLIDEAVDTLQIHKGPGPYHELTLKQRVLLLLLQRLFQQSNRMMASMLAIFSVLSDVDVSYKSIERLYSDEEVLMALHNLHIIILRKRGVTNPDVSGDGTGYSLTISRHYASAVQKEKDNVKEEGQPADQTYKTVKKYGKILFTANTVDEVKQEFRKQKINFDPSQFAKISTTNLDSILSNLRGKRYRIIYNQNLFEIYAVRKGFAYSFKWIDNKTKMYISYGTSLKSEKDAYDKANKMLDTIEVKINSVRLDRYYSCPTYVDAFDKNIKVYVIPKKNATLNGGWHWKKTMFDFVKNTPEYLEQYYQRENSEAGWSADKRHFGWDIAQRKPDRIDTADLCTELWHNLLQLGVTN